ncbi:hypothetical protein RchiOBHm_Chr3g0482261 [Rosa chinensis]|uniref:Uncharacterized protein n=1 Tax=Rosa chinensis TaxID=74649 RepID=A0A2P6RE86_ROSCH|nr:hypothetical protein RchiOBHm_Chr3g0482261 [Rosa chinensis]
MSISQNPNSYYPYYSISFIDHYHHFLPSTSINTTTTISFLHTLFYHHFLSLIHLFT